MKKIEFQDYPSTETPLSAENLNQMQTNIEYAIQTSEVYSTEEQVIGTWIDGKPLYRKVVQFTIGNINTSNQYRLGIAAETIVSWKGYFKNSSNQYWAIDNFYVDGSNANGIWVFVDATNDILYEQHNYSYPTGKQATFTIEYTKN